MCYLTVTHAYSSQNKTSTQTKRCPCFAVLWGKQYSLNPNQPNETCSQVLKVQMLRSQVLTTTGSLTGVQIQNSSPTTLTYNQALLRIRSHDTL